jgi:hypothetical protein
MNKWIPWDGVWWDSEHAPDSDHWRIRAVRAFDQGFRAFVVWHVRYQDASDPAVLRKLARSMLRAQRKLDRLTQAEVEAGSVSGQGA